MNVNGKNDGLFLGSLNVGCAIIFVLLGVFFLLPVFASLGLGWMIVLGMAGIAYVIYRRSKGVK